MKDALLSIEDFSPKTNGWDTQKVHAKADRAIRGAVNGQGRDRGQAAGELAPTRKARSPIFSTGEDTPGGYSLKARLFVAEMSGMDWQRLTRLQHVSRNGLFAGVMSA